MTDSPRRRLLRALPLLSRVYGLKPWDIDQLTFDEIEVYLDDLNRLRTTDHSTPRGHRGPRRRTPRRR